MGNSAEKPKFVYIVTENRKPILCTYSYDEAHKYFEFDEMHPRVANRELIEYNTKPTKGEEVAGCLNHTYAYL